MSGGKAYPANQRKQFAVERSSWQCGGQLHPSSLGKPGDRIPCPSCGKTVTLRRPFNGNNTGWVQVPGHKAGPHLSSVQRFVLKEILLDSFHGVSDRKYGRTREALFSKGLLTSPWCGQLTDDGRVYAKAELDAEIARRQAAATGASHG